MKCLSDTYNRTRTKGQSDDVRQRRPWSEAEVEQLLMNREVKKLDYHELATVHGRSINSMKDKYIALVKQRADRGDDRNYVYVRWKKLWSEEDEATVAEMLRGGARTKKILEAFPERPLRGLQNTLTRIKVKEGLPTPRRVSRVDEKTLAKVMELKTDKMAWNQIVDAMPGFGRGELQYAYRKALKVKKEAEMKQETDGSEDAT
jgi:hypothetical protein